MKIKKIGHCCLFIQTSGLNILTDPGNYSVEQDSITGIDVVLITHEHADHLHIDSVKAIVKNNPKVAIISNLAVGKLLDGAKIQHTILEGSSAMTIDRVPFEAFDCKHEEIFEQIGQVQNTGYFIDTKLFYPGDSFGNPNTVGKNKRPIEILALPVAGPWCRIGDAIRYAIALKPTKAFPVHDAGLRANGSSFIYKMLEKVFVDHGIQFRPMKAGDEKEF